MHTPWEDRAGAAESDPTPCPPHVTLKAHAKINWALNITGRRGDGYHLLDMVMHAVELHDDLALSPAGKLTLTVDGAPATPDNLVLRAARALNERAGTAFGARMALTKRIPEQAGLGGGSADCAAALTGLNRLWGLGFGPDELRAIGLGLGADVPFCLTGGLARVWGSGEHIAPARPAPRIPLVLVRPGAGLSTGAVFRLWDGGYPPVALDAPRLTDAVLRGDLAAADRLCANALTAPAVALLPGIADAIAALRRLGAAAAFMTGSGSTAVGAFDRPDDAARAAAALPGALLTHTLGDADSPDGV